MLGSVHQNSANISQSNNISLYPIHWYQCTGLDISIYRVMIIGTNEANKIKHSSEIRGPLVLHRTRRMTIEAMLNPLIQGYKR